MLDHVAAHLIQFAHEFHWTPAQVWALRYGEYKAFARHLDELADLRRRRLAELERR